MKNSEEAKREIEGEMQKKMEIIEETDLKETALDAVKTLSNSRGDVEITDDHLIYKFNGEELKLDPPTKKKALDVMILHGCQTPLDAFLEMYQFIDDFIKHQKLNDLQQRILEEIGDLKSLMYEDCGWRGDYVLVSKRVYNSIKDVLNEKPFNQHNIIQPCTWNEVFSPCDIRVVKEFGYMRTEDIDDSDVDKQIKWVEEDKRASKESNFYSQFFEKFF